MDTYTIDIELEHYFGERVAMSSRDACRRLYVRATARFHGPDLEKYLYRVQRHAKAYASISRMLRSPFRHLEAPLFMSSLTLFMAGIITYVSDQATPLTAAGTSAGFLGMFECCRRLYVIQKEHSIREAVFSELAEALLEL